MNDRADILALIPHQGAMCLLDRVLSWDDERIECAAASHRSPDNPLRDGAGLRALHLCEYGAQAMAVHGGLLARRAGASAAPGLLVSLRAVRLHVARIDALDGELRIEALRLLDGGQALQYAFKAWHRDALLAEGRAAVMQGVDGIAPAPAPHLPSNP